MGFVGGCGESCFIDSESRKIRRYWGVFKFYVELQN